jgi:hypothetical protein
MSETVITKTSQERFPIGWDFSELLPSGETLDTGTLQATINGSSVDASSFLLLSTTASIGSGVASGIVRAGLNGVDYKVKLVVTTTPSSYVYEESILLRVRD